MDRATYYAELSRLRRALRDARAEELPSPWKQPLAAAHKRERVFALQQQIAHLRCPPRQPADRAAAIMRMQRMHLMDAKLKMLAARNRRRAAYARMRAAGATEQEIAAARFYIENYNWDIESMVRKYEERAAAAG